MSDYGIVTEAGAVRFERLLPAPVERVWAYLTQSELRRRWFAGGEMELREGGRMELVFRNSELSGEGEEVPEKYRQYEGAKMAGRVIGCDPPRLLVHSWDEADGSESEVSFELAAEGESTRLVLTHRRLADAAAMRDVSGGWHSHLAVLEDLLAGRRPRAFWANHAEAEKAYAERIAG
jgi:uncharacterized protein YndB with AHSA1/START domain